MSRRFIKAIYSIPALRNELDLASRATIDYIFKLLGWNKETKTTEKIFQKNSSFHLK